MDLYSFSNWKGSRREQCEAALIGCEFIGVTKTNNRKVLGNLNDLTNLYKWRILDAGGYKYCDVWRIISSLNRMPQRKIGWGYSIDLAKELINHVARLA